MSAHIAIDPNPASFQNSGYCYCCDSHVEFVATSAWWRDDYRCAHCGSIPRERALMFCVETFYPNWRQLLIHESSPVIRRVPCVLRAAPGYIPSQYFPGGKSLDCTRHENLEKLTFADESVDLHITQDVFEHLLDPDAAFKEIARTLRPGGAHIFTTPLPNQLKPTVACANREPKIFHANHITDEGSLLTFEWGYDISQRVFDATGMFTEMIFLDNLDLGIRAELIEVLITRKL
jgi:SAM-dependent methyltransferase